MNKVTTQTIRDMKSRGEKIVMLTGYDCPTAKLLNEAGIDVILVGDSLGMVKLGFDSTLPVTLDDMVYHCKSVRRGNTRALLVADMPFMSYEKSIEHAVANAGRLVKDGGAEAVKIEGGAEMAPVVAALAAAKIPVMGHIGLTPQAVNAMGGYHVQGKNEADAHRLIDAAVALEQAGVFALVMECVPGPLADNVSRQLKIPVIGIGAGPGCDGQVLVVDDMLGMFAEFTPKFVKRYADLRPQMLTAFKNYAADVKNGAFPAEEHTYT